MMVEVNRSSKLILFLLNVFILSDIYCVCMHWLIYFHVLLDVLRFFADCSVYILQNKLRTSSAEKFQDISTNTCPKIMICLMAEVVGFYCFFGMDPIGISLGFGMTLPCLHNIY